MFMVSAEAAPEKNATFGYHLTTPRFIRVCGKRGTRLLVHNLLYYNTGARKGDKKR